MRIGIDPGGTKTEEIILQSDGHSPPDKLIRLTH